MAGRLFERLDVPAMSAEEVQSLLEAVLAGPVDPRAAVLAGAAAGSPQASQRLRAVYTLLLAFDARLADALDQGTPLIADPAGDPVVRTLAAIGVIGADYWLGHTDDAVAVGERLAPVAARVREQVPFGLPSVSQRFEDCGTLLYAAEAAEAAALAHAGAGRIRAARASGQRATVLRDRCEGAVSPWLAGATAAVPLTSRERQVAALAADGSMDAEIATRLGISARTVQTHLAHVYSKLGVHARGQLAGVL